MVSTRRKQLQAREYQVGDKVEVRVCDCARYAAHWLLVGKEKHQSVGKA